MLSCDIDRCELKNAVISTIAQDGMMLEFISNKTYELCMTAVAQSGHALQFVPTEFITEELLITAVIQTGFALKYIPVKDRTYKLCKLAVEKDGCSLRYARGLPDEQFYELAKCAIMVDRHALQFVPYPTEELYQLLYA